MKKWHTFITSILLCSTLLGLSACGQQKTYHKAKPIPMDEQNVVGGGHKGYFQSVHSTKQLKQILKSKKHIPKEIQINTSLNGNTNGVLQNEMQEKDNHIQDTINKLKQKPKLRVSNNVRESQRQKMNQAKKNQQKQWKQQEQQQKKLINELNQDKKNQKVELQQKMQPVKIKVPSNTTIVSSPNVHIQNIELILHGRNIKLQNLDMQVPSNKLINNNPVALNLNNVDGVRLNHDEFSGVSQIQNIKNKKRKSTQRPITRGTALQEIGARHVYMTNSKLSGLATGFSQQENSNHNNTSIVHSQFNGVNLPFNLIKGTTNINNIEVQYNKGLSLFQINNPEKIDTKAITINVNGENPNDVANKLLKMAKNTTPTYFINRKIEINGHGYKFITKNGILKIISIPSPNNKIVNNVGAVLSRSNAIRD